MQHSSTCRCSWPPSVRGWSDQRVTIHRDRRTISSFRAFSTSRTFSSSLSRRQPLEGKERAQKWGGVKKWGLAPLSLSPVGSGARALAALGLWQCHAASLNVPCYGPGMPLDVVLVTATWEGISLPSQHGEIAQVWIYKGAGKGTAMLEPPLTLI